MFTAIGRAVKGAAGNVRTTNVVRLTATDKGTRVDLEADLAMGGVMGSARTEGRGQAGRSCDQAVLGLP